MQLAKDHWHPAEFDGPDWVPFNLWMHIEHGNGEAHSCACRLLYGLPDKPRDARRANPDAVEIWTQLAKRYRHLDAIAFQLPHKIAEFFQHWHATPKLTPKEYTEHRLLLATRSKQLASELRAFPSRWDYGDERAHLNFTQFLSDEEQTRLDNHVASFPADLRPDVWEMLLGGDRGEPSIVPDLPTLLERVAEFFEDDGKHPPLARPGDSNAARNYLIDRLIGYFELEHGQSHPSIIARIAALFFEEAPTVDDVAQRKRKHPITARRRNESLAERNGE